MTTQEIAAWLQAQSLGTVATDLFEGELPDTPVAATAVYATPGGGAMRSHQGVEYDRPTVQIFVRRSSTRLAMAAAWTIYNAFHNFEAGDMGGHRYGWALPIQPPYQLEKQEKGVVVSFNVELGRAGG